MLYMRHFSRYLGTYIPTYKHIHLEQIVGLLRYLNQGQRLNSYSAQLVASLRRDLMGPGSNPRTTVTKNITIMKLAKATSEIGLMVT